MLFILIIVIIVIIIINKNKKSNNVHKNEESKTENNKTQKENETLEIESIEIPNNIENNEIYTYEEIIVNNQPQNEYPYERKLLLTKREWAFYKKLKCIADKYNLHILSKVRMEDIIRVKEELPYSEKSSARGRIKSRHIDFIIADPENLYILLAIELDDNSHKYKKAKEIDQFKNEVFEAVGLPYIRTYGYDDIEKLICEKIKLPITAKS